MKVRNITGQTFGQLTAVELVGRTKNRQALWLCKCTCGGESVVPSTKLVSGHTKSCGCQATNKPLNLMGQRFGRLLALYPDGKNENNRHTYWTCMCDCGSVISVSGSKLKIGHTKSCGCIATERVSTLNRKHGRSRTALYAVWKTMRSRCYNPKHVSYQNYGARGIYVCDEWRNSYEAFVNDMGERPVGLTLERINNDGPYAPWNCKWATCLEQSKNKRPRKKKGIKS